MPGPRTPARASARDRGTRESPTGPCGSARATRVPARPHAGTSPCDQRDDVLEHRYQALLAVGEQLIERAARHARAIRHIRDRRIRIASSSTATAAASSLERWISTICSRGTPSAARSTAAARGRRAPLRAAACIGTTTPPERDVSQLRRQSQRIDTHTRLAAGTSYGDRGFGPALYAAGLEQPRLLPYVVHGLRPSMTHPARGKADSPLSPGGWGFYGLAEKPKRERERESASGR